MEFKWQSGNLGSILQDAHHLRQQVFVHEQKIAPELEIDQLDDQCEHLVVYLNHEPVATARLRPSDNHQGIIQRVAVKSSHRRQNLGLALMKEMIHHAKNKGYHQLVLGAQESAIPFYLKSGFQLADREPYMDAGIPHRDMIVKFAPDTKR